MLYAYTVTCPAGTKAEAPYRVEIVLRRGVLVHAVIVIPPGHAGLTGLRIKHGLKQIIPFNEGTWIIGDDVTIRTDMYYELYEEENILTCECFNYDNVYDHSFYLYFDVLKPEIAFMYRFLAKTASMLERIYALMTRTPRRPRR